MKDILFVTATKRFLQLLFRLTLGIEYHGLHHIPATGPALIVSNHQSFLDPLLVGAALRRSVRYMATRQLFSRPTIAAVLRFYGAFPVNPRSADTRAIKDCLRYLRGGELVMIFPEGERSRDGRLLKFFHGFAHIAVLSNVPIVPVTIHGAVKVLPRGAKWPRPGKVRLTFHAPLDPRGLAPELVGDAAQISGHVRNVMQAALYG